jgi:hypothetical protein
VGVGKVQVNLVSGCLKQVNVGVYSSAYRKIKQWNVNVVRSQTVAWDLTDAKGRRVSAGLYYMVFTPQGDKRQVKSVVVLR